MNRRSFFQLVAGAAAWLATQHVAWVFPEHHPIVQHWLPDSVIWAQTRKNAIDNMIVDMLAHQGFVADDEVPTTWRSPYLGIKR